MPRRLGWMAFMLFVLAGCGGFEAPQPLRHAVLITVDTLRADRVGAYGYADARTPRIDAIAAQSIRFENAFAHSSMTAPSLASLLTGRLPGAHGLTGNRSKLPATFPTLATRLGASGFASAAFIGNFALRPSQGFGRGFDRYTQEYRDRESVRSHPENLARRLTDEAIAWLEARDPEQRLLLWVHYQEPHGPYTPPEFAQTSHAGPVLPQNSSNSGRGAIPKYQWLGHGRSAEYAARYDGEIAEVDREVGRLLDALTSTGVLEDSILAFSADHGEALGEGDLWFAHGEGLDDVLLRVPLLLRLPRSGPGVRSDVVRLVDVAPTILESLGIATDAELDGESLLRDTGDRPVVAQVSDWRSIRDGGFQLIQRGEHPAELSADSVHGADERRDAHARLSKLLARLAPAKRDLPDALSEEERRALQALGYVE